MSRLPLRTRRIMLALTDDEHAALTAARDAFACALPLATWARIILLQHCAGDQATAAKAEREARLSARVAEVAAARAAKAAAREAAKAERAAKAEARQAARELAAAYRQQRRDTVEERRSAEIAERRADKAAGFARQAAGCRLRAGWAVTPETDRSRLLAEAKRCDAAAQAVADGTMTVAQARASVRLPQPA